MNLAGEYMEGVEYARTILGGDIRQEYLDRRMADRLATIAASTQANAQAIVSASKWPDAMEKLIIEGAANTGVADAAMSVPIRALMVSRNPLADALSSRAIAAIGAAMWQAWCLAADISPEMLDHAVAKAAYAAEGRKFISMDDHLSEMCEHLPPAPMTAPERLPTWLVLDGLGDGAPAMRLPLDAWLLDRISRTSFWSCRAEVAFAGITPPSDSACIGSSAHINWIRVWRTSARCDTLFFAEGVDEDGNRIRSVDASMLELRDALAGRPVAGGCAVGKHAVCFAQTVERARALAQQNPA